jgi:hypothetical protein
VDTHDDEGRIEIMSRSQMCDLFGLTDDGTSNILRQGSDRRMDEQEIGNELEQDIDGAAIPTNDDVPGEMVITYDKIRTTHRWRYGQCTL